jgi:spermidine synthase
MKSRAADRKKRSRTRDAKADANPAPAPTADASPAIRRALYLVFALSGLSGLVYEVTWTRYLQLFLGHAAYAQVLVLSLFMGGMAAGALAASRLSGTRISPLVAYAAIEGLLGVAALLFHPVFDSITSYAYLSLLPGSQGSGTAQLSQWLLASTLILPQSILLGMTFPLMSASVLRLGSARGGRVFAMLYFSNSAGAVIGVLIAGFWLIEDHGLRMTMMVAGAGNLGIAAVAIVIARRRAQSLPPRVLAAPSEGIGRWLLAFAFLTGAASFLYEITWLRMLALVQGSSTHAFETMLSAFILGIALGGLWIRSRIERYRSPLLPLARVQILMGLAALATLPAYDLAFDAMAGAMALLPRDDLGYLGYNVVGYLISAGIMVPASFFAGMTLPLLTYVLYSRGRGEADIGAVYGWNTLGGIAGTAMGGLVLMPLIGLKNTLVVGAVVDIALGLVLTAFLFRRRELPALRTAVTLAAVSVVAVFVALVLFQFDVMRTASGVFRHGRAHLGEGSKVVHHADGRTATVDVIVYKNARTSIATNGKVDAEINMLRARGDLAALPGVDEYTMTLLAAVPLSYAPDARKVAVIGHGSGLTTHVLLGSPTIEGVDVIEIEPEMIRGAREFLPRVARAYDDPRARYFIEDARAFFARASRHYDIIVSEPSNPWVSGVASLFTPEFYRQAERALAPNGLFIQWFHTYETDRTLVGSIVQGIGAVFSDYALYAANDSDVLLVATASGSLPPVSEALFGWPGMRAELDYLGIRAPADLAMFRIASRRAYAPLLETGHGTSDYFPYLEFGAARARFLGTSYPELTEIARDPVPMLEILSGFDAPRLPSPSTDLAWVNPRFGQVLRANLLADALAAGDAPWPPATSSLPIDDRRNLEIVRNVPPRQADAAAWQLWFSSLFALSKAMISNGGAPSLERYLQSARVRDALRGAPAEVRDKVEFLLLVGRRDLDAVRREGPRLLAGSSMQSRDPMFHAYVFVATTTACLAGTPDASCRQVIAQLDRVPRGSPVIDVLRAHQSALH